MQGFSANQGDFATPQPPGNIWQCLETLFVTAEGQGGRLRGCCCYLAAGGQRSCLAPAVHGLPVPSRARSPQRQECRDWWFLGDKSHLGPGFSPRRVASTYQMIPIFRPGTAVSASVAHFDLLMFSFEFDLLRPRTIE